MLAGACQCTIQACGPQYVATISSALEFLRGIFETHIYWYYSTPDSAGTLSGTQKSWCDSPRRILWHFKIWEPHLLLLSLLDKMTYREPGTSEISNHILITILRLRPVWLHCRCRKLTECCFCCKKSHFLSVSNVFTPVFVCLFFNRNAYLRY